MVKDVAPDAVIWRAPPQPDAGTWRGPEGFLEALAQWTRDFEEWSATVTEMVDAGDRVVVRTSQQARGSTSGVPVEADFWLVYSFADEKIVRIEIYADERQAREAAGLEQ